MKTLLLSFALLSASSISLAAIEGSSISNAHIVTETSPAVAIRGRAPKNTKEIQELLNLGITDFLIFKNETKNEVQRQLSQLTKLGVKPANITHIPFLWKDLHDFQNACNMTIQAMQVLEQTLQNGRSIYFHCTVGEDRTGYLAGLWGFWTQSYRSPEEALKNEMCARGYEAGNPGKPYRDVVYKIRETLTPTYLKMAVILTEAKMRGQSLDVSLCEHEPQVAVNPQAHFCQ